MSNEVKMRVLLDINCICGKRVYFGHDEENNPCMVHTLPTCEKFDSCDDPSELLRHINQTNQQNIKPSNMPSCVSEPHGNAPWGMN